MPLDRPLVRLASVAALLLTSRAIEAQQHSRSASVTMSLRVLSSASFEGASGQPLSAVIVGGVALRVDPSDGVHTRMTYNLPTLLFVAGTPLVGPDGARATVRFVCAIGSRDSISTAEPFNCAGGTLAVLHSGRTSTVPIAVGAQLPAYDAVGLPAGLYAGRVTLTAVHPAY
ncbi:MAG: hypothetical protein ABIV10_02985 [Gemmatimonadaceae bacterium]